jgi:signal transduction histidine kinase
MSEQAELAALAQYLSKRRNAVLEAWQNAIRRDPALNTGESLPRVQLLDHLPSMLATFERALERSPDRAVENGATEGQAPAAAHGLQRWRQGYDLREVTRELGKLNECMIAELDAYTKANPQISHAAVATARRVWAAMCSTGIEQSVGQFFELQQQEAAGHVKDLESVLTDIQTLEQQRGDLWREMAHDLRGNLGIVANATVGLTHQGLRESSRDEFIAILMRGIASLHHLLDDITSLARLQAGREHRRVEPLDVAALLQPLCDGIRPLAQQRRLFLRYEGAAPFQVDGDGVKIRRIAQNLILNAVKFTVRGGVTVRWSESEANDPKRWMLTIQDTGPGLHSGAGNPLAQALDTGSGDPTAGREEATGAAPRAQGSGEGIGLSIVKRLCDMLDAAVEVESLPNVGTTFRVKFPRNYPA